MLLDKIALTTGTDKSSKHHNYTSSYNDVFFPLKEKNLHILELGVSEGSSLSLWKQYFINSLIVGVDIINLTEKKFPNLFDTNCKMELGSQDDALFLKSIFDKYKDFDIIIDDASHMSSKTISSFNILFPLLNNGGIYVVEDLGIFYPNSGKGEYFKDLGSNNTTMDFLKSLIDCKNDEWYLEYNGKETSLLYKQIKNISFYRGICFIFKE